MIRKYLLPVGLLIALGITLVLLPDREKTEETAPEVILREMSGSSRLISADRVAERMVNQDPSLFLVDIRTPEEYQAFSLPGAFNIPLAELLSEESETVLGQEGMEVIFFDNDGLMADRAWAMTRREGLRNTYVLHGGLNSWFDNFYTLSPPGETASAEQLEQFQFRMGVRQFLTGGELQLQPQQATESITIKPRAKKSAAEGGC